MLRRAARNILALNGGVLFDPATVGQFTGLKDKSGREIYEGDVVKYGDTIHEVVLSKEITPPISGLFIRRKKRDLSGIIKICNKSKSSGNVHDNPELLEEAW